MVSKASAAKKKRSIASSKAPGAASAKPQNQQHQSLQHQPSQQSQQVLLNIFSDAFASVLSSDRFPTLLQEIKQALFQRDFVGAFAHEDHLEAYAARWSPTRALCYASVFSRIRPHADHVLARHVPEGDVAAAAATTADTSASASARASGPGTPGDDTPPSRLKMLCIGGCAAEHVAFAAHLHEENLPGALHLVDAAPWGHATALLQRQLTTPPPLSKYASEAARAANVSFLEDEQLAFQFTQADILSLGVDDLRELVGSQALVVTLLFTLNELYTEGGIGKTTSLLGNLGRVLPAGSLLLVVDSPGSYSEAALGREKKRYPMQWLLRHTLLGEGHEAMGPGPGPGTGTGTWEQLESEDSVWFRLPEGLAYPIPLENMRYQVHLYRVRKR